VSAWADAVSLVKERARRKAKPVRLVTYLPEVFRLTVSRLSAGLGTLRRPGAGRLPKH
jgi:hypothetical protein